MKCAKCTQQGFRETAVLPSRRCLLPRLGATELTSWTCRVWGGKPTSTARCRGEHRKAQGAEQGAHGVGRERRRPHIPQPSPGTGASVPTSRAPIVSKYYG